MPATQAPRRPKHRFPDRELLERVRRYEELLRQNNINFEPLHKDLTRKNESPNAEGGYGSNDEQPEAVGPEVSSPSTTVKSERVNEAK